MDTTQWGGRSTSLVAFAAAAILTGLIISLSGGGMPPPAVLDALSVGTAASALVVVVMAYAGLVASPWVQAGRALALSGMTLVLAGDGLQAVATRGSADSGLLWAISFAIRDGIGNGLFFASLLILGAILWSRHRWLGGLAMVNGLLGYLELAFAARLGLPPHLNFTLLVVWFVILGVVWWRVPSIERQEGTSGLPTGASVSA
ncbi:MAG: hypothetical protein ACRDGH_06825 [Candidatus Limnocylindria bacterium]